jgi:hypothetical protein
VSVIQFRIPEDRRLQRCESPLPDRCVED